jgi:DNA-binding transcriptional ArsR family regulator
MLQQSFGASLCLANEGQRLCSFWGKPVKTENPSRHRVACEFPSTAANPKPLPIPRRVTQREYAVGELALCVGLSQAALSWHLAKLDLRNLVGRRRDAQTVCCFSASPAVRRLSATPDGIFQSSGGTAAQPGGGALDSIFSTLAVAFTSDAFPYAT